MVKIALFLLLLCVVKAEVKIEEEPQFSETPKLVRTIPLSAADKQFIVDEHNAYRRKEHAKAMMKLRWDDALAKLAGEWAQKCVWQHRPKQERLNLFGYWWIGENMITNTNKTKIVEGIRKYYDEKQFYNLTALKCKRGQKCGHYTQVVWHNTETVGCADVLCANRLAPTGPNRPYYFQVCDYGPGGNVNIATDPPFKPAATEAEVCSECPKGTICELGLCVRA